MNLDVEHPEDEALQRHAEGAGDGSTAAHVAACPECREKAEAYGRLFEALGAPVPAPQELFRDVMAAVAREKTPKALPGAFRGFLPRAAAVGAAAAVLLSALLWTDASSLLRGRAEGVLSSAAEALPSQVPPPSALNDVFSEAFLALEGTFDSAASAGERVLEPVRSFSSAPLLALAGIFAANAAAYLSLRRRRRGEFQS